MKKPTYKISKSDQRVLRFIVGVLLLLVAVSGCFIAGNRYWLLALLPALPVQPFIYYADDGGEEEAKKVIRNNARA